MKNHKVEVPFNHSPYITLSNTRKMLIFLTGLCVLYFPVVINLPIPVQELTQIVHILSFFNLFRHHSCAVFFRPGYL